MSDVYWSDELCGKLKQMWNVNGLTATEIATVLGISRNAVMGKAHRLKLKKRPNPIKYKPAAQPPEPDPLVPYNGEIKNRHLCHAVNCYAPKERKDYCTHHASIFYKDKKND